MSEQPTIEQLLAQGIQAAREKRREQARQYLLQVIERDQWNEQAWLWLSGVVDDPRDMQVALANALTINPANEQARQGLDMLRKRHGNLLHPDEEPPTPSAEESTVEVAAGQLEEELPPGATGATLECYSCGSEVYDVADFCWNCHAVVHCCENCIYRRETTCKELRGIRGAAATVTRNECPWWTALGRPRPAVPPWEQ